MSIDLTEYELDFGPMTELQRSAMDYLIEEKAVIAATSHFNLPYIYARSTDGEIYVISEDGEIS